MMTMVEKRIKTISDGLLKVQKGWILFDIMRVDVIWIRGCGYANIERLEHFGHLEHLGHLEHIGQLGHIEHFGHLGHLGQLEP